MSKTLTQRAKANGVLDMQWLSRAAAQALEPALKCSAALLSPGTGIVDSPHDLSVDPRRADGFYTQVRTYWPQLPDGALAPGYAGIRPKIYSPHEGSADFLIQGPQQHGIPGLVNLFGIESPGLTSALAIGEMVGAILA